MLFVLFEIFFFSTFLVAFQVTRWAALWRPWPLTTASAPWRCSQSRSACTPLARRARGTTSLPAGMFCSTEVACTCAILSHRHTDIVLLVYYCIDSCCVYLWAIVYLAVRCETGHTSNAIGLCFVLEVHGSIPFTFYVCSYLFYTHSCSSC